MARIQIGNHTVEVDDSFLTMSPQDQQSTVDEIEASLDGGAPPQTMQSPKSDLQTAIPPADMQTGWDKFNRKAKLGLQAVGQGVGADLLGAPADFKSLAEWAVHGGADLGRRALNVTNIPANAALSAMDAPFQIPDIPPMRPLEETQALLDKGGTDLFSSMGAGPELANTLATAKLPGGDQIGDAFSSLAQGAGYEPAAPENWKERLGYNATRLASGALTGSGILRSGAKTAIEGGKALAELHPLLRPYAKNAGRTMAGDVGGGLGAAATSSGLDELAPESVSQNPLVKFAMMVLGGYGGSHLATAAAAPKTAIKAIIDKTQSAPAITADPKTGKAPSLEAQNQAAAYLQGRMQDPAQAKTDLGEAIKFIEQAGGNMPTSAMSTPDLGMRFLEKSAVLQDPQPYRERYDAVAKDASNDVKKLELPNADREAPKVSSLDQINAKRNAAQDNVAAQQGQLDATVGQTELDLAQAQRAEQAVAAPYKTYARGADGASIALDQAIVGDTMEPLVKTKNDNFDGIDPERSVVRDVTGLSDLAKAVLESTSKLPPALRSRVAPEALLQQLQKLAPDMQENTVPTGVLDASGKPIARTVTENVGGDGKMDFKTLNEMRAPLAAAESEARSAQQIPLVETYKKLKAYISQDAEKLAAEGGDAGQRASEALRFYQEDFAPFTRGEGGKLRKAINTGDRARTSTPPTATAGRFLNEGPGSREAAADFQEIIAKAPNPEAAKASARSYVLDNLQQSVINSDGKVSETSLQTWINKRQGMLSQMPELSKEVDGLLNDVRSSAANTEATAIGGKKSVNRMRAELENAKIGLRKTEREINRSALSLYDGRSPENAAAALLGGGDPVAQIKELKASFNGNKAAEEGLKASIADNLVNAVTNADGEAVSYQKLASQFKKNEPALEEVFGSDMSYLRQAHKRLEMLARKNVQGVAGSGTTENNSILAKLRKPYELIARLTSGALMGGSKARSFNLMADQFPDSSKAANDLLRRATLDPRVAKHLLGVDVKEVGTPRWNAKLNRLMGWAEAGRTSRREEDGEDVNAKDNEAKE